MITKEQQALIDRIEKAKKTIESYPEWVRESMKFVGTGVRRGDNE